MPWTFVRKLFLLLFAVALSPLQVSAAQTEQKSFLPHFSKLLSFKVGNKPTSRASVDFSEFTEKSAPSPISESYVFRDSLVIFSSPRWAAHLRGNIDDEHIDFIGDLKAPFYADVGFAYSLINIRWRQTRSVFNHFTSDHRLSGWKETNAMYVALNNQFSA